MSGQMRPPQTPSRMKEKLLCVSWKSTLR
jgi:hypothetical protein